MTIKINSDGSGKIQWSECGEDKFSDVAADAVSLLLQRTDAKEADLCDRTFSVDAETEERLYVADGTLYFE